MPLTQPSKRRLRPVQLRDLPLEQRLNAAAKEAQRASAEERVELFRAAILPSDTTYYIRP